ncbi:MAG: HEPN domain-containing protein, partial [Candidatus Aminicenantes bacterium]|nr:HEPN domain-containing protein [Candidatus Aminicenantes bacterium]
MTLTDEDREILIKHRTSQAYEAVEDAQFMIDSDKLKLAVNRIYYGMFYVLSALALKYKFKTSKHKELIGWFNKTFIKERLIDRKYGPI